jgi:hypothetical protein
LGLWITAVFTIVAGVAEIITGFRHEFFGITTSERRLFTFSSAPDWGVLRRFWSTILLGTRAAAGAALVLLSLDFVGRFALVASGLYPLTSRRNAVGIVAGTALVVVVAAYVWRHFFRASPMPEHT